MEIPSDNIEFSRAPAMKAAEITDATIELIRTGQYRFGRINFANGDMVGHSGDIEATVSAIEVVDKSLGRLLEAVAECHGTVIVTADHGNADEMFVEKNGERIVRTAHSLNPVPFVIIDSHDDNAYSMADLEQPGLANVAATVFNLLGYRAPEDYMPSLIRFPGEPESRRPIHHGSVVNLALETVKLPNHELLALEIVRHPGGAVVVARDEHNQVGLIRQFRHAAGGWIWEFPAGLLEAGEHPIDAAKRELREEAGCTADTWGIAGDNPYNAGILHRTAAYFPGNRPPSGAARPTTTRIYRGSLDTVAAGCGDGTARRNRRCQNHRYPVQADCGGR